MTLVSILERTVQDGANTATVSGVNGAGLLGAIAKQLPGPTIDRGYTNLRFVSEKLDEHVVPVHLEKQYDREHDRLFDVGLRLKEEKKALSSWGALKLGRRAWAWEADTLVLRDDVQTSSDLYRAKQNRRYAPSVHSVTSEWVLASAPQSPALEPTGAVDEP
ncbi:hypothetical protein BV20DRAFT_905507, partial [Pilatotrama ljubarskyi]